MKKLLLVCAFFFALVAASSAQEGIKFETGNFASLLKKAEASDKLIFMDIYAEWCGPCKYMANNVFTDAAVGEYFNANFINAKIDAEKGEGVELARKYGVRAYPTFLLINSKGERVGVMVGGSPADEFIDRIAELAYKAK
ncbi:MAG: thioredoxin family protein [Rikenellaceae bacterium]